jgi:hypothetical protein
MQYNLDVYPAMTIAREQATFHQSLRYFRPGKPTPIRNTTGEWATKWRRESRLVGIRPAGTTKRLAHQKNISISDVTSSDAEAQGHNVVGNLTFNTTPDFGHNVLDGTHPPGGVAHPIISVDNVNKDSSSILVLRSQRNVQTHDKSPIRQSKPIEGSDHRQDIRNSIDGQTKANAGDLATPRPWQPESATAFPASILIKALPTPAAAWAVNKRSVSEIVARQDLQPEHTSLPFDMDRSRRSGGNAPKPRMTFGTKVQSTPKSNRATSREHFHPVPSAIATAPRHSGQGSISQESKNVNSDENGLPRQSESSSSVGESSNLVGELWLDTLALREWLQTYLSGEMGHALQATSRFGTSFE